MKKLIGLFVLKIVIFCGRSNGVINCGPDKFPSLNTESKPNFRTKEGFDLSGALCRSLKGKTGNTDESMACTFAHLSYFKIINVDSSVIEKYTDFCSKHKTKGSCYQPHESSKLLSRLMYYCWSMNDIAESNRNVFNKDLKITPDDWKNLYDVENMKLPLCFDKISSENYDAKESEKMNYPNQEYKNLVLLKKYKTVLNGRKSFCNCVEILELNVIFDMYITRNLRSGDWTDKPKFIEDVCIKSNKKHFWKKEQLQAISDFVTDYKSVAENNMTLWKLVAFLVEAGDLANNRWYSDESKNINSKWPIPYVLQTSLVDGSSIQYGSSMLLMMFEANRSIQNGNPTVFDKIKFNVISKAIYYGFTPTLFHEFINLTNNISIQFFNYPYNKWECRQLIMDVFLDYDRQRKFPCVKYENYQYNLGNIEHLNQHLMLLNKLNRPYGNCSTLAEGVIRILKRYYSYWCKLDPTHFTNILTAAFINGENLFSVAKCLKFSSNMEKQILENQLLKYPNFPSGLETNDITNFEEKMFRGIREKIFETKEMYVSCIQENLNLKTVVEVLEKLYPLELTDLFLIPDKFNLN